MRTAWRKANRRFERSPLTLRVAGYDNNGSLFATTFHFENKNHDVWFGPALPW